MVQSNTNEWNKEEDQVNQVIAHIVSDIIENTLEDLLTYELSISSTLPITNPHNK